MSERRWMSPAQAPGGRCGFTLIELMAVLVVSALIATMATSLVVSLLGQQRAARQQLRTTQDARRLAERFRRDVEVASEAAVEAGQLTLRGADETIVYRALEGPFVRREAGQGDAKRGDDFEIAEDQRLSFRVDSEGGVEMVRLTLTSKPDTMDRGAALEVLAELARHHRAGESP